MVVTLQITSYRPQLSFCAVGEVTWTCSPGRIALIILCIACLTSVLAWMIASPERLHCLVYTLWGTGLISFTASNLQSTTPTPLITL